MPIHRMTGLPSTDPSRLLGTDTAAITMAVETDKAKESAVITAGYRRPTR